jgi:hypothetical protein
LKADSTECVHFVGVTLQVSENCPPSKEGGQFLLRSDDIAGLIDEARLTLYATRHLMADWLDNSTVAKRTRDRILGHVTDVPGGYGRKGSINADQMAAIAAPEPAETKSTCFFAGSLCVPKT